jgi:hypothetical protein
MPRPTPGAAVTAADPNPQPDRRSNLRDRHALNTPLTLILIRSQLLSRRVGGSPSLPEPERAALLAGLAAIEAAAHQLGHAVDAATGHAPGRDG